MFDIVNGFSISYRVGATEAEVRKIDHVDEFGRLVYESLVFRGTWKECEEYARTH